MTSKENLSENERAIQTLEEICENTRAIRRVVNRVLDHLHETEATSENNASDYDPDNLAWEDLNHADDMYS